MVGGFGVNRIPLNTVDVLDMSSGIVSAVNKLPKAMFGVGACVFKGKIYVIKDTILVYKSEEDSWDRLGRLTVKDVAQAVADEENIYITTKSTYDLYRSCILSYFHSRFTFHPIYNLIIIIRIICIKNTL